jgi:para-aminobenzoate synthetase/4-amino-4-deoxychorismate lyase
MPDVADLLWPDRTMGVFETLLVLDGAPIELDAHLERLRWSARDLFKAEPPPHTRELVLERAAALPLGRMRLTVLPGAAGGLVADTVAAEIDRGDVFPSWERAIALRPFVVPGGLGNHKWADRAGLAWTESGESAGWLPLVVDVGDEILEASRANVFAVEGETLVTPEADGRILPGVARSRAVTVARSLGIEVRQEALTVERLVAAGAAFLTGSVRGIEPVRSFGEAELGPPGETVARVAAEMERIWTAESAARQPRPAPVGSA